MMLGGWDARRLLSANSGWFLIILATDTHRLAQTFLHFSSIDPYEIPYRDRYTILSAFNPLKFLSDKIYKMMTNSFHEAWILKSGEAAYDKIAQRFY